MPSDELSKSFVLGSGRRSLRARHHHLSLSRVRQFSRIWTITSFSPVPSNHSSTLTFRFIFMYLPLSAFEVVLRDRILSVRLRNSGYVSLYIIHCSVDPEGCRSSNKCCLRVILPPFRHPVFANLRALRRRSLCVSSYPLPLSCPVIPRLDVVIALHYCQKFSAFFTTSFRLRNARMNLLNLIC